jgi:hypothetical protein
MNPLRKIGWTLLLATSWLAGGCAPQGDAGVPAGARKQASGPLPPPNASNVPPAQAGAVRPAAATSGELPRTWPWIVEEEDEFEGEGWSFWPLAGPRR